jgi:hypothetical protein
MKKKQELLKRLLHEMVRFEPTWEELEEVQGERNCNHLSVDLPHARFVFAPPSPHFLFGFFRKEES